MAQADRADRQAEDDPVHRGPARRRARARSCAGCCATSPRTRRSATPRRSPIPSVVEGIKARYLVGAAATTRSERVERAAASRSTGPGATGRSSPARAVVVDIDGVLSDAVSRQHYLEAPRRDWQRVLRRVRRRPGHRGDARCCSTCSTPSCAIVLLTARPERVHHLTEAWLRRYQIRWDLLVMRPWGDYDCARDFKQATVWDLRDYGFELAPRLRGRPPQRRRCSAPRASPASTSTPATTTDRSCSPQRCWLSGRRRSTRTWNVLVKVEQ